MNNFSWIRVGIKSFKIEHSDKAAPKPYQVATNCPLCKKDMVINNFNVVSDHPVSQCSTCLSEFFIESRSL